MIKLIEPFQPKIGFHTNTGFLQSLWDKYVPATSENYDRISLIYLHGMPGEDAKPKQQVNLLVNLVLKNFFMQINLSQNPMLFNQTSISGSVRHLREIYLNQLKKIDFQLYQSLKQYAVYLERSEKEEIRYREWAKENQAIIEMQREYRVLEDLSKRLKILTTVQSVQLERKYGKNLFRSLDKKEYKLLSEAFLWAEKKQVEEYIQHCSEKQHLRICKLLKDEPELYSALKEAGRTQVTAERSPLADVSGTVTREQLILLIRSYGQKEFRRFCHQVLFPDIEMDKEYDSLLQAGILWKKSKKEIYQQFKQMTVEEIHHFWEEIPLLTAKISQMQEGLHTERVCRKFSASLTKMQKKYVSEISTYIQDTVLHTENEDEFEIIKNAVDVREVFEKDHVWVHRQSEQQTENHEEAVDFLLTLVQTEGKFMNRQVLWSHMEQIQQRLSKCLREQEQKIIDREQKALEKYEDIYIEILSEKELLPEQPDSMNFLQASEKNTTEDMEIAKTFREKYGITKLSRTWIEKLQSWSEVILTFMEEGDEKVQTELSHQQNQNSKDKEDFQKIVIQLVHALDTEKEKEENSTDGRITQQEPSEEGLLVYREEWIQNIHIRELLQYFRQVKTEERKEFIRQLADMIIIQRKIANRNRKLESWGEALLTFTEQGQEKAQAERSLKQVQASKDEDDFQQSSAFTTQQGKENTQAALLRKQIQMSKDKADFQRLSVQLTHYMEEEEEKSENDSDTKTIQSEQRTPRKELFVYREEQLQDIKIQELLRYLRQIKREERQEFIRQLADVIVIQRKIANKDINQEKAANKDMIQKKISNIETIRKKYEKNISSKTWIQKLESWGEALLTFTEQGREKVQTERFRQQIQTSKDEDDFQQSSALAEQGQERTQTDLLRKQIQISKDKADFQRLSVQLAHYMGEEEEKSESDSDTRTIQSVQEISGKALFVYREEQLQDIRIQELLQYLRQIRREERQEFIRQLADIMFLQKKTAYREITQKQIADREMLLQETAAEMFLKKYEAYHPSKTLIQKLDRWSKELLAFTEQGQENSRIEITRQKSRSSKDKTEFQRLSEELVHYIKEEADGGSSIVAKVMQSVHGMSDRPLFVYREEQIQNVKIQELLQHLRQVKEGERQELIRQLAGMILIQKYTSCMNYIQEQEVGTNRYERLYESYPELAFKIRRYEEQRKKMRRAEHERMKIIYANEIETVLQSEERTMQEEKRFHLVPAHSGHIGHQEIKYVFSEETLPGRKQKNEADLSKETLQITTLQQQMEVRLREVERKLQKKGGIHSGTGDDVRAIAEKVKKQLHEELHMERLRRGLA